MYCPVYLFLLSIWQTPQVVRVEFFYCELNVYIIVQCEGNLPFIIKCGFHRNSVSLTGQVIELSAFLKCNPMLQSQEQPWISELNVRGWCSPQLTWVLRNRSCGISHSLNPDVFSCLFFFVIVHIFSNFSSIQSLRYFTYFKFILSLYFMFLCTHKLLENRLSAGCWFGDEC